MIKIFSLIHSSYPVFAVYKNCNNKLLCTFLGHSVMPFHFFLVILYIFTFTHCWRSSLVFIPFLCNLRPWVVISLFNDLIIYFNPGWGDTPLHICTGLQWCSIGWTWPLWALPRYVAMSNAHIYLCFQISAVCSSISSTSIYSILGCCIVLYCLCILTFVFLLPHYVISW